MERQMRTRIVVHAALLSLALTLPAWGSTRIQAPAPVPDKDAPLRPASPQSPVMPPAPLRGQMLYENHCMVCHESIVHIRTRQAVQSLPQLRARVQHWTHYLQLQWGQVEIEEVVIHLNTHYYRFDSR
jgi:hypothetical protein